MASTPVSIAVTGAAVPAATTAVALAGLTSAQLNALITALLGSLPIQAANGSGKPATGNFYITNATPPTIAKA